MALLALVVGLFDPAERYMRKHRTGRAPLAFRGWKRSFVEGAVLRPGGARQATAEELASMRERAREHRDRHQAALERARSRWHQQALICARELLDSGTTVLSTDGATVRGKLVRFWRGDSVLDLTSSSRDGIGHGSSMTRLRRHHSSPDVIATYLVHQVAQIEGHPGRS